MKYSDTNVSK